MIAVTEKHTKNNLDDFADALEEVLSWLRMKNLYLNYQNQDCRE
jgi:glycine cleavage system protein P-like pyridoxal-binding family